VLDVEADTAEVGLWLANYQRVRKAEYRNRIFQKELEVRAGLARLKALDLTPNERRWTAALEHLFNHTMSLVGQILKLDADVAGRVKEFVALAKDIDQMLDDQIQTSAREGFLAPTRAAEQATLTVIDRIKILLPLFILSALGVGLLLVRVIVQPVKGLSRGTAAVARGDLTYRVRPTGRDELADLSNHFNLMVAELEATTVSKRQLEASEQMLTHTVERLRAEISERVRAEQEQVRLQASLRRAETMAAMGALVAGVAHEVRNPLFGISAALDAMDARFGARREYERYLSTLRDQVVRLTALMNELLEYGRPSRLDLVPGSVADVLEEAVRACAPLAETRGARIVKRVEDGAASVRMERTRLARVFENILRNALQHSPPGGTVAVETRETPEDGMVWIQCAITDSGPGIPAEDLPQVFDPFFTRRRGGTGLGLSIVQRIVEEHDGRVTAGNGPEGGAVVTVSLPLVRS